MRIYQKPIYINGEREKVSREKLNVLTKKSHRVLYKIRTVWPFDFFPDTVSINENSVDLTNKLFFYSQQVYSIPISDIKQVVLSTSLFFAEMNLYVVEWTEKNPPPVRYLRTNEALEAKCIIDGLIACQREGIDVSVFDTRLLKRKFEEIGHMRS